VLLLVRGLLIEVKSAAAAMASEKRAIVAAVAVEAMRAKMMIGIGSTVEMGSRIAVGNRA
jgi:hypothetical protein